MRSALCAVHRCTAQRRTARGRAARLCAARQAPARRDRDAHLEHDRHQRAVDDRRQENGDRGAHVDLATTQGDDDRRQHRQRPAADQHREHGGEGEERDALEPSLEQAARAAEQRQDDEHRAKRQQGGQRDAGDEQHTDRSQQQQHRAEPEDIGGREPRRLGRGVALRRLRARGGRGDGVEDLVEPIREDRGSRSAGANDDARDLVRRPDREIPDDALVGDPRGRKGQRQAEGECARRQHRQAELGPAGEQVDREQADIERQNQGQCRPQNAVDPEQAREGCLGGMGGETVYRPQRVGDAAIVSGGDGGAGVHSAACIM